MSNHSLGWQKLQDVYYYIRPCYELLKWPSSLYSSFKVEISTHSTLVALATKLAAHSSIIDIFTISGQKVSTVVYNSLFKDHIVDFAFHGENLVVVLNNRRFRYYSDLNGGFNEYEYSNDLIQLLGEGTKSEESDSAATIDHGVADNDRSAVDSKISSINNAFRAVEAKVWDKWLVIQLKNSFIITDLTNFTNYHVSLQKNFSKIHHFSALSTSADGITLIIGYNVSVLTVKIDVGMQEFIVTDEGLTEGPFTEIATSPNGMLVCLYAKNSKVFVINRTFDQVLLEYDTSEEMHNPYQVAWCGNDAIILSLQDELKLIGPSQNSISFYYDLDENDNDPDGDQDDNDNDLIGSSTEKSAIIPILKTEVDGLRVITPGKVEFLSRVPESSLNLYQIGSSAPSSILLDCIDKLSQHSPKADTNISLLKGDRSLEIAMNECLQASLEEFQPFWQKKLLRAVSFGKVYCDLGNYDADEYMNTVATLRVLNQIRSPDIGIFLTYKELLQIGWQKVIDMLLIRNLHYLALHVTSLIKDGQFTDKIYIHWCCSKIRKEINMSDFELFKALVAKLKEYSKDVGGGSNKNLISVDKISDVSYEEGRVDLCKLLINLEPSILKKINSFIGIGDLELALIKAFQTGDFDICKLILLLLQEKLNPVQFFKILNQNQRKSTVVDTSLDDIDPELKDFLHISDDTKIFVHGELITNFWLKSVGQYNPHLLSEYYRMEEKHPDSRTIILQHRNEKYEEYKAALLKVSSTYSNTRMDSKAYDSELHLLETKHKLVETYQIDDFYQDKSQIAVITRLIRLNQLKQAGKVSKEFKVSKEKYWYLILDTLTKSQEFEKLHQFILSQNNITTASPQQLAELKAPIPFKYIIDRCLNFGAPKSHISVYITNCSNIHYSEKINYFIKNKDLNLAALEAYRFKDIDYLNAIKEKAKRENSPAINAINTYINRLGY